MDITRQSLADPLPLASRLIACPSITPATGAVFTVLEEALVALGFEVDRFVSGDAPDGPVENLLALRSEEHTSELQSLMRISYAVFCLKKKKYTSSILVCVSHESILVPQTLHTLALI